MNDDDMPLMLPVVPAIIDLDAAQELDRKKMAQRLLKIIIQQMPLDKNGDPISYKFKTTGKMVDDYICPEGKFDIILFGKQSFNAETKKAQKVFLKEYDGEFPAKDSLGLLDDMPDEFPNDLGLVVAEIAKRYQ
jgi:hypothetical protein